MQLDTTRQNTLICGASSTGKNTLAVKYLLNRPAQFRFIFDPQQEFAQRLGWPAAVDQAALFAQMEWGWVVFDPMRAYGGETIAGLDWFCNWVFECCDRLPGHKIVVLDEITLYCNPHTIPKGVMRLVENGRKVGVEMIFISNAPRMLNESIGGQLTEVIGFQTFGRNSLKWLADYGVTAELDRLPLGQYISTDLMRGGATKTGKVF